jgi:nucleoside 2-deoxyribosyltransferase
MNRLPRPPRHRRDLRASKRRAAQVVVANLALFRGAEAYSGTVFEKGMATASGLPVVLPGLVRS